MYDTLEARLCEHDDDEVIPAKAGIQEILQHSVNPNENRSKSPSSLRVALWRRLRRLGTISPTGGVYILPAKDESVEAFQWLARRSNR